MHLWLSRVLNPDRSDLIGAYARLSPVFDSRPLWDAEMQVDAVKIVLEFLQRDAVHLPSDMVIRYLKAAVAIAPRDSLTLKLILDAALSVLHAEPAGSGQREAVTKIATDVVSAMRDQGLPGTLQAWLTLHRYDTTYVHLFGGNPETFAAEIVGSQIHQAHPDLRKQTLAVIAATYPRVLPEKS
jgi:hypothetical protein